jgi:hypothetical protein
MNVRYLSTPQGELLVQLLEAEQRGRAASGKSDTFAWHTLGGGGDTILMHRGAVEDESIDPVVMEALIAEGLLQRTGQRAAVFTPAGLMHAERLQRERQANSPVDVSWDFTEPILKTLWELWTAHGAPPQGVAVDLVADRAGVDAATTERVLDLLEQSKWAEKRTPGFISPGSSGPTFVPTPATMRRLGGWPALDDTAGPRLLAAVQAELDATDDDDDERRTRLATFLESAKRVGEGTLTQVLGRLATGQIHL